MQGSHEITLNKKRRYSEQNQKYGIDCDHDLKDVVNNPQSAHQRVMKYDVVYSVHLITRNSFGLMTRKLSVTESQRSAQFRGTFSRRKLSVASANWAHVA